MRLIDADALVKETLKRIDGIHDAQMGVIALAVVERIKKAPTVADIVRCKDCRHRYEEGDCTHYYWCRINDRPIDDTDFCSWGERKGGTE